MAEGEAGFHMRSEAHTWQSGLTNGKLEHETPAAQPPKCPQCNSQRVWRDGLRYPRSNGEPIQRWQCRDCALRFSESHWNPSEHSEHVSTLHTKSSYTHPALPFTRQVCVTEAEGTKNLEEEAKQIERQSVGVTTTAPSQADVKGKIVELAWHLKKEGYSYSAIDNYPKYLKLLVKYGADLYNPDSVKTVIAQQKEQQLWGSSSQALAVAAYTVFASLNGIVWKPPKIEQSHKLPFIPLESELDALIASGGKKMSATLQLLKEVPIRIGEACRLKWTDLDSEHNTITINQPEKHGLPRMFKVSSRLVTMLNALPKESEHIFGRMKAKGAANYFSYLKKRVAHKLQNPRILSIHLHTFRHWNATMEYHKTKDILHIMKRLGHRNIQNTLIYTQLIQFESDEYSSAVANTTEEAQKLIEAGFEYVCSHENVMLFRKRK